MTRSRHLLALVLVLITASVVAWTTMTGHGLGRHHRSVGQALSCAYHGWRLGADLHRHRHSWAAYQGAAAALHCSRLAR